MKSDTIEPKLFYIYNTHLYLNSNLNLNLLFYFIIICTLFYYFSFYFCFLYFLLFVDIYIMKKNKETEDIHDHKERSVSLMPDYSKSFALAGGKKFVNISLPQIELKGKDSYKKQPFCYICGRNFTTTFRQHHCRVCANAACNDCSRSMVNKERACDICIMRLSNPQQQKRKKQMLQTLQTLCAYLLYQKKQKMNQLQQLKNKQGHESEQYKEQLLKQQTIIKELEEQNIRLKDEQKIANEELEKVRNQNQKIQEEISAITNSIIGLNDDIQI